MRFEKLFLKFSSRPICVIGSSQGNTRAGLRQVLPHLCQRTAQWSRGETKFVINPDSSAKRCQDTSKAEVGIHDDI